MAESSDRELAIFSDARQLPPDQRTAFLTTACGDDPGLRHRVEELLRIADETAT